MSGDFVVNFEHISQFKLSYALRKFVVLHVFYPHLPKIRLGKHDSISKR